VSAALQIWSHTYCKAFDQLPTAIQDAVQRKVDKMGARLGTYPHHRLTGRSEYRLRVGDYRVLYELDVSGGRLLLHYVGHRREIYKRA
jgi:mRNA interferase RelE/StbE